MDKESHLQGNKKQQQIGLLPRRAKERKDEDEEDENILSMNIKVDSILVKFG